MDNDAMLYAFDSGDLELRSFVKRGGASVIHGRFPYGKRAVLSDGGRRGRPRKEVIAPRAFSYRVNIPEEDIHLLLGHDYGKPLASRASNTLKLTDTEDALTFEAKILPEIAETTHGRDALALISSGLALGLSPGFRLPPKRAVATPERVENEGHNPEQGEHNAVIRTVLSALLYELSIVTRPAYSEAQVEARSWQVKLPQQTGSYLRWR